MSFAAFRPAGLMRAPRRFLAKARHAKDPFASVIEAKGGASSVRLVAAAVIERLPRVTPDADPVLARAEELSLEQANRFAKPWPNEFFNPVGIGGREDERRLPLAKRVTKADMEWSSKSVNKALDKRLFLVVRDAHDGKWRFPEAEHATVLEEVGQLATETNPEPLGEGAGLMEAAQFQLLKDCGADMDVYMVSYSPFAHLAAEQTDKVLFFFRGQFLGGKVRLDKSKYSKYAWSTHAGLKDLLEPEYHERVASVLRE